MCLFQSTHVGSDKDLARFPVPGHQYETHPCRLDSIILHSISVDATDITINAEELEPEQQSTLFEQ